MLYLGVGERIFFKRKSAQIQSYLKNPPNLNRERNQGVGVLESPTLANGGSEGGQLFAKLGGGGGKEMRSLASGKIVGYRDLGLFVIIEH